MADYFGFPDFIGRTNIRDSTYKDDPSNKWVDKNVEEISLALENVFFIETYLFIKKIKTRIKWKSLQLLLETLNTIIIYFNDLNDMKLSNKHF